MKKIPVIIDCDPGHDDAIAILLALASEKIDIRGITIVGGNQTLEKCLNNTLKFLSHLGMDLPVSVGAKGPMLRDLIVAPYAHGESGMDGPVLAEPTLKPCKLNAIELMEKTLRESKDKVTLVALGPLTNIAIFLCAHPELKEKIDKISLMGGTTVIGNRTPTCEFNIWEDPEAAHIVFTSGLPIVVCPLDVTYQAGINDEEVNVIRAIGNKASLFFADLLDFFSQYHRKFGRLFTPLHDPCAVAYLIDETLFETKDVYVEIDRDGELTLGSTVTDLSCRYHDAPNCKVALKIDRERFVKLVTDSMKKLSCLEGEKI